MSIEVNGLFRDPSWDDLASFRMLLSACENSQLVHLARTSCSTIAKFLYYHDWITLFTPLEYRRRHIEVIEAVRSSDRTRIECMLRRHYEETGRLLSDKICQEDGRDPEHAVEDLR